MTSDHIQNNHLHMRSRIARFREMNDADDMGIELTRLENFLEGRHDIFDVLEKHAANTRHTKSGMDIPRPSNRLKAEDKHKETLDDFWSRLKAQIKRLREEEKL